MDMVADPTKAKYDEKDITEQEALKNDKRWSKIVATHICIIVTTLPAALHAGGAYWTALIAFHMTKATDHTALLSKVSKCTTAAVA